GYLSGDFREIFHSSCLRKVSCSAANQFWETVKFWHAQCWGGCQPANEMTVNLDLDDRQV
ncbi:MAG: hypothetical protein ACK2UW_02495, partial [Anaerolineales bacterium]